MDVQGGKGICLGPRNYLGRGYQATPVAITVEGANILTRNLIIFGQGAIRCHPFVLKEMEAARNPEGKGVDDFDRALFGHIGFTISNAVRSLVMALTFARFTSAPGEGGPDQALLPAHRALQRLLRLRHRRRDADARVAISRRRKPLGPAGRRALLCMYLASMVLKHYENQGRPRGPAVVEWACRHLLYKAQEQLHGFLRNFPNRLLAWLMRAMIFPRGRTYFAPGDKGRAADVAES
jgi:acyl-CoA dehydrogenase